MGRKQMISSVLTALVSAPIVAAFIVDRSTGLYMFVNYLRLAKPTLLASRR